MDALVEHKWQLWNTIVVCAAAENIAWFQANDIENQVHREDITMKITPDASDAISNALASAYEHTAITQKASVLYHRF